MSRGNGRVLISSDVFCRGAGFEGFQKFLGFGGEHAEVAGDGEELHALGGALEGGFGVHDVHAGGGARLFAGGDDAIQSGFEFGVGCFDAVRTAHVRAEIDGADEDGVDSGEAVDGFGIGDALRAFRLEDDKDFVVGLFVIIAGSGGEVKGVQAAAEAAIAERWILRRGDDFAGLLDGVDHRSDETPRAGVKYALDEEVVAFGYAGERDATGVGDGAEDGGGLGPIDGLMLHVEREPFEAHAGQHASGVHIAEAEPGAEGGLAAAEFLFDGVGFHVRGEGRETRGEGIRAVVRNRR